MSLSTHVLDAVNGVPAVGLRVSWHFGASVVTRETDSDGRISSWGQADAGVHRLVFDTGSWFGSRGQRTFYPEVSVVFEIVDAEAHHHVPLLLSPFAYSTYRGS
ncbi:hydroxyisourate hydrolase [Cryptosporangium sp. NPDC048952]|uniref:hydroxyisourate hydrolase n=1 Tax=Cryptosporangium sp. NPDC048952 TaxID=3363961 RepID=UPI00371C6ABA